MTRETLRKAPKTATVVKRTSRVRTSPTIQKLLDSCTDAKKLGTLLLSQFKKSKIETRDIVNVLLYIRALQYNLLCYQMGTKNHEEFGELSEVRNSLEYITTQLTSIKSQKDAEKKELFVGDVLEFLKGFFQTRDSQIYKLKSWNVKNGNHSLDIEEKIVKVLG